jgi:hypothetical protein
MKHQMRALEEFAADNDLELHDVLGDGNCMFRALEDQMQINAQFGHTARSLRRRAVEYAIFRFLSKEILNLLNCFHYHEYTVKFEIISETA